MVNGKICARIKSLLKKEYRFFKAILFTQALLSIAILLFIFSKRINYPFELEWMEGSTVEHIYRLFEGKKIYTEPTLEFIPHIYTPFFSYLGYIFSAFFGIGFFPLRLISIISSVGTSYLIYRLVYNETKSLFWSIIGIGIYTGSYGLSGFWYDLARVDSLANFFTILSLFLLIKKSDYSLILSILTSFLAFYTKQSQIIIIGFIILPLLTKSIRKFLVYLGPLLGLIILSVLLENFLSNGWFCFWNFTLPKEHDWVWSRIISFWTTDILPYFSISFLLIIPLMIEKSLWKEEKKQYFFLFFLASLINSYLLRLHYGGYNNVFIPLIISIAILLPVACSYFQQILNKVGLLNKLIFSALIIQLVLLFYNPERAIPKEENLKGGRQFIEFIAKVEGEVFIPCHSFISRYAEKKSYAHFVLLNDLFITQCPEKNKIIKEWEKALITAKFDLIILDPNIQLPFLDKYYIYTGNISKENTFTTPTGNTYPYKLFVPR